MARRGDAVRRCGAGWMYSTHVDTSDYPDRDTREPRSGKARYLRRAGFRTKEDAKDELLQVETLVRWAKQQEPDDDEERARLVRQVGDLIFAADRRNGRRLPTTDELRLRFGQGEQPTTPKTTLGDWLDRWLRGLLDLEETTLGTYRARVENVWKPHLGHVRLDRLHHEQVSQVFVWIRRRNEVIREARAACERVPSDPLDPRKVPREVSLGSQRQALDVLMHALNAAVDARLLPHNPLKPGTRVLVRLPRPEPRDDEQEPFKSWTLEEARRFLAHVADHRLAVLFRLCTGYTLRRGEAVGLRWQDVDLDEGVLRVRVQRVYLGRRGSVEKRLKSRASRRDIALDPATVAALRRHRAQQAEEKMRNRLVWEDHDLVFCLEDGRPIPPHRVTFLFERLCDEAGVPYITLHGTRHTAVTLALRDGEDVSVVQRRAGHANVGVTLNTYRHVLPDERRAAAARVGDLLDGEGGL